MKKYISFAFMAIALSFGFAGCSTETSEEPGGTNVQKMAGRWDVQVDIVDESGSVLYEDPYGLGTITILQIIAATRCGWMIMVNSGLSR